jgi:hypothetical protein
MGATYKFEARNPKFETMTKNLNSNDQNILAGTVPVLKFGHLTFGFVSKMDRKEGRALSRPNIVRGHDRAWPSIINGHPPT